MLEGVELVKAARAIFAERGGLKERYAEYKGERLCLVGSFIAALDPERQWFDLAPQNMDRAVLEPLFRDMGFQIPSRFEDPLPPGFTEPEYTCIGGACKFNNTHSKDEILARLDSYIASRESNNGSVH